MKQYNFDKVVCRQNSGCMKADLLKERFGREDLIPLWIADMDFCTPDFIVDALKERCCHEIFGYPFATKDYQDSIISWVRNKHNFEVQKEWLTFIPGIVKGIAFVIECFSNTGDKVIIQPPVYPPFRHIPELHKREVVDNPLQLIDGEYKMDLDHLESIIDDKCRILILCNPHNPGGVVWDKETLARLAEICQKHNILVISDEIHSDMAFPGYTHNTYAAVSEAAKMNSITFMAPSKTFNIAGIVSSFAIVPNQELRDKFFYFLESSELNQAHIFAYVGTTAAYSNGQDWLNQMMNYVVKNVDFVEEYLAAHIPQLKIVRPQASFLIWLDCRGLNMNQKDLVNFFINEAKLALNDGSTFGQGGEGFMRLNVGCPKAIIEKALNNLREAVERMNN